jgi:hypothetical protein
MIHLEKLPLTQEDLDQYRFKAQKKSRPSLLGGHVGRRKGQSLAFREYAPYQFGDDLRHVDWRASARYRGSKDWLVRRFVAEEQFKLVISIDTRPTMNLPTPISKLQVAFWLAESLTRIALPAENSVVWHHLFGHTEVQELRDSRALKRVPQTIHQFATITNSDRQVNLDSLQKHLPPAAIWLIITDLYFNFDKQSERLAQRIREAQDGSRWVILLELDSWPYEKDKLGLGPRELKGIDFIPEPNRLQIGKEMIAEVDRRIEKHKSQFLEAVEPAGSNRVHWKWPASTSYTSATFKKQFNADKKLQQLFMRDK